MKEVLKRGLLVVLAIMLCAMPVVAFSGCDNENIVEITNVQSINSYTPYNHTVWYNKTTQRMVFYRETGYYLEKYDIPSNECTLVYERIPKTE